MCWCTDASEGGLSGRRGGWEEEEELDFGGRGFLGRIDGREGFGMSPTFSSSPTRRHKHGKKGMNAHTLGTGFNKRVERRKQSQAKAR